NVVSTNSAAQLVRNADFECPSDRAAIGQAYSSYLAVQGGGATAACSSEGYPDRNWFYNGLFFNNSKIRQADITDGSSKVFMVGESRYLVTPTSWPNWYASWASSVQTTPGTGAWGTMYATLCAAMKPLNSSALNNAASSVATHDVMTNTFGSRHSGGAGFVMADASVQFITDGIDLAVYRSLGSRNDGAGSLP
ncbi:MAG: DUF1559 domain-containing protein, partial [Planctomycetia bacterium]